MYLFGKCSERAKHNPPNPQPLIINSFIHVEEVNDWLALFALDLVHVRKGVLECVQVELQGVLPEPLRIVVGPINHFVVKRVRKQGFVEGVDVRVHPEVCLLGLDDNHLFLVSLLGLLVL